MKKRAYGAGTIQDDHSFDPSPAWMGRRNRADLSAEIQRASNQNSFPNEEQSEQTTKDQRTGQLTFD
ncbi:hypothetical protein EMPG_15626 [Blastomyces silverae]|uniref:Uncharacterized protein n=1 Tax=Blastomyces silverae TaxID=2060906 RepID=A0A0H1BCV2_9EURO|nr:hypothetical protein EMPG_15626 [Blastomyces silverae]